MMRKKALILCPPFSDQGGVSYYYSLVKKHFKSEYLSLHYFHTGRNYKEFPNYNRFIKSFTDLISILKKINRYDLIIINPSLDYRALIRDGIFHFVAKYLYRKKTLIFFHGWIPEIEVKINRSFYFKKAVKFFFQSDRLCVLSKQFKKAFISWGFDSLKIIVETTIYQHTEPNAPKEWFNIVFLSRFVKGKGCLEAIKTVQLLIDHYHDIKLYMVGDGDMFSELESYVNDHHLNSHIFFTGYLNGEKKSSVLAKCAIMIYPTSYGEGLPISILEGMGMGCIVITRPVGGLIDILENCKNGFLVNSLLPSDFAEKIDFLYKNKNYMKQISIEAKQDAMEKFDIKNVVKRLEKIYLEPLQIS